jgi:hypothetical protein
MYICMCICICTAFYLVSEAVISDHLNPLTRAVTSALLTEILKSQYHRQFLQYVQQEAEFRDLPPA